MLKLTAARKLAFLMAKPTHVNYDYCVIIFTAVTINKHSCTSLLSTYAANITGLMHS